MKRSYFQDFVCIDNKYYLHINFMNMSFLLLDEMAHDLYATEDNMDLMKNKNIKLYDELSRLGFLIEDDIDEHSIIELMRQMELHDKSMYHLIINPTLDCNLSCWYCYEDRVKGSRISEEIINGIKRHIEASYNISPFRSLNLSFFGGEPFLDFHAIKEIVFAANMFCKPKGINLNIDFTTNGSLITQSELQMLSDFNCTFQITLDGNKEQHNKVKFSRNKDFDAYTATLNNIKQIQKEIRNSYVFLRINFDKQTLNSFDGILHDINDLDRRRTTVILKRIWQVGENKVNKDQIIDTINKLFEKDFVIDYYTQGKLCFAERMNETVINFDGKVFKCTTITKFNDDNSYGKLNCNTGRIEWNLKKLADCAKNLRPSKCKACRMYPSCYGPCNNHILSGKENCYVEELDLSKEEYFLYLYKSELQKRKVFNS
ncbi:radical SAM protein [uncultured Prevotella sp.]|jgi:uncharacterized protein|uniref:radical SAM/SPASM domain-containing protein n=1 Tax=uncultured Prevotella sp. TaxID=159272 RepID=UPI00261DAFE4|nr:radical SAM protein [uncultured Prevotella sp.]